MLDSEVFGFRDLDSPDLPQNSIRIGVGCVSVLMDDEGCLI